MRRNVYKTLGTNIINRSKSAPSSMMILLVLMGYIKILINDNLEMFLIENPVILLHKVVGVFCLSRRISLTSELILFSFTVKLLIGLGKVYSHFGGGYLHPPTKNHP